ncbi:MAG: GNAT family N-acetyltransferase [Anaerolineae bacterium]
MNASVSQDPADSASGGGSGSAARDAAAWRLQPFVPQEVPEDQWARYHTFRRIRHDERDPDEPLATDEVVEKSMKVPELYWRNRRHVIDTGDEIIAYANFESPKPDSPEYESTKHLLYSDPAVIGPYRRRGLGTYIMGAALEELDRLGARVFTTWTCEDDGRAFAEWCGAERKQTERLSRLDFRAIDWSEMEQWAADLEARGQGTKLEMYPDRLPDSLIDEFCPARTELMNRMPWDDAEHGDIVVTPEDIAKMYERLDVARAQHHNLISREPDGTISGMTDVVWRPDQPGEVEQWFTGVDPDYAGRGIGKALKAAMVLFLRDRYDGLEWVRTGNSTTNAAMLSINERMGFEEYQRYDTYQISRDDLARHLAAQAAS